MGNCAEFMAAWDSTSWINCTTCKYWDWDELTCLNKDELAKREKARALDDLEKLMRQNKSVVGPL